MGAVEEAVVAAEGVSEAGEVVAEAAEEVAEAGEVVTIPHRADTESVTVRERTEPRWQPSPRTIGKRYRRKFFR